VVKHFGELEIEGLDYRVFLGADQADNPPSPEYCQAYAEGLGVDPAKMLIDPDFQTLFTNIDSGQQGGVGLPWDAVVDGRGMVYHWNESLGGTAFEAVQALLAQ
jgi:hypothetical protein